MFSPGSSQKRKRVDKVVTLGGGQSETSDSDDSAVVLRPIGKIPHCDASSGRIYRNGDFLSINSDRKKFLLYRDVLHTLNPSTSQFETMKSTATTSFSNFPHEICYAIDAQGDRTIIGCSRGGEVFFASPTGGIYAQSQLECCKDLSDEVSTICAVDLESSLAIVVGTKRGDLYLVGCPRGSTRLFAVGPLEGPTQPLLRGLVESGVKMLGFGLSGLGFGGGGGVASAAGGVGSVAARRLYGAQGCEQVLKLVALEGEGGGHVLTVTPSSLSLWATSSTSSDLADQSSGSVPVSVSVSGQQHYWGGQCLAEHDLAELLSEDVVMQLRGKVTSKRDADITNREFVVVDVLLFQCTPMAASLAVLTMAPPPPSSNANAWELWLHMVDLPLTAHPPGGRAQIRLRRRVAFLHQPPPPSSSSKQLLPELFRKERSKESDSLFITWFNGVQDTGNGQSIAATSIATSVPLSFHALEVVDIEQFCPDESKGEPSEQDDSGAYLEYLHLHASSASSDSGSVGSNQWSCLAEGVVTGVPLAAADTSQRPFLSVNVVASLNNTAYSSGRNRATQTVSATALPIYELTMVWCDGTLFACVPPTASCLQLYTTRRPGAAELAQQSPEEVIMHFLHSEGKMSENQCFTALVKATSGVSRANSHGKLLNRAGAVSILDGALAVSHRILNQREPSTTSKTSSFNATSSELLSHRLLLEKKQKHDQLFPLMHAVLDNSNAGDLNLRELSWHRTLLLGGLVLSNHMREVRMYGEAPAVTATRGGGMTSSSGRFSHSQSLSQSKKRVLEGVSGSGGSTGDQDGFLSAVQRGIDQVLPPGAGAGGDDDMPGRSPEDIFFAHPFLLPLGLYRIAKEIEQRHLVARGQSNHTVLAAACSFLSLLLSVIQAPKVTDFSFPLSPEDKDSSRRRVVVAGRQNKKTGGSVEDVTLDHIQEDSCCLALASDENIRAASYTCLRVLEDCVSIRFNEDFSGSSVLEGAQKQLDTKRLYKLVHIVLFGYETETSLLVQGRGEVSGAWGGRGDTGSSPPAKISGGKSGGGVMMISGGKKNGKEYANIIEQCHLFKKCGVTVFFASNKLEEAFTLSSRFKYFEGMCRAALGGEREEGAEGLRKQLETVLRRTLAGLSNDLMGYVDPAPLHESPLSQFVLAWLEEKSRFSTLLEVGECMHPECMQIFLKTRPYLKWIYTLKKKDYMSAALHSFGYTQFDRRGTSARVKEGAGEGGFAYLLPRVSSKAVEVLDHLPPSTACLQGPSVTSTRCAKSLLSVSKLCAWVARLEEGEQQQQEQKQPQPPSSTATISATNLFDMNKKALLSIRAQEFLAEYSKLPSSTPRSENDCLVYQRETPDVLVKRLLGLVQGGAAMAPEVFYSSLSLALGVLNLNKESYLDADEQPSSAQEWYSLVSMLWCTSMTSTSEQEKWLQLASGDPNAVQEHESLLKTTDLFYLLQEVAADPCVNLLRESIVTPNRASVIVDHLIKHLEVSPDKKDRLIGLLKKCVQLAIIDI